MFTKQSLNMMLESTPVGYAYHELIYDEHGEPMDYSILDFNPSYLEIIGVNSQEVRNKYIFELFPNLKEEIPQLFESVNEAVINNKHTRVYGYVPSFNKWLEIHFFSPHKNFFIAQLIDLTKEKALELSLLKRSNELEDLINAITDLVITIDSSGKILSINKAWGRILGYDNNDLLYQDFSIFIHPEDTVLIETAFEDGLIFNPNYVFRSRVLGKDGVYLFFEWKTTLYEDQLYAVGRNVTEIIEKEKQIQYLSYHDKLTGLYNRAFFEEELKRLDNNRNLPLAVIMGDVNGLKIVNDVFGHLAGDKMLKSISEILINSCRNGDIVSRWGGDEFVILLPNTTHVLAKEIINRINLNCKHKESDLQYANISLGYSVKESEDVDITDILVEAENNMYKNKIMDGKEVRNIIISSMIQYLFDGNYEIKKHIDRIKKYCSSLAKELNLSDDDLDKLLLLSDIHDIGKISIPKEILDKPGKLNDLEWAEIEKHSEVGYRIAKSVPELSSIADLILHHHECWNGSGYPHGLKGEEIPLLSRIFTVIDAYDAITQDKPHRKAMDKKEASNFLIKNKGIQFDPDVVDSFLNILFDLIKD